MARTEEQKAAAAAYARKWRARNRDRHNETARRGYANNRERIRARQSSETARAYKRRFWLDQEYGITPEQHEAMFAAQGFACAVCGSETSRSKTGQWHTDHSHTTGKVRGILCRSCNTALGLAGDDPSRLDLMAQYVRHHAR